LGSDDLDDDEPGKDGLGDPYFLLRSAFRPIADMLTTIVEVMKVGPHVKNLLF